MFARFGRSIDLAKASFGVLRSDKELLIFPLVSFIVLVLVSISFFVPFYALGGVTFRTTAAACPSLPMWCCSSSISSRTP